MFNVLKRRDTDPNEDFNGLWLNEKDGSLWVWNDKTNKGIKVGFAKDGMLIGVDVFEAKFEHNLRRNQQNYTFTEEYSKIPLMVLAEVDTENYEGSAVEICFGSCYGKIFPQDDRFVVVNQIGNVAVGDDLTISCEPTSGSVALKVYIISYE